jgi:hypothetical protein
MPLQNGGHAPIPNNGQFSEDRFAFLFKPGSYAVEVPVGFYTQVLGLGASPDGTVFTSDKGVYCEEGDYDFTTGSLDTFWRGAENFKTTASFNWAGMEKGGMLWSVSQAAPLRRVHVTNELQLYEYQPPAPAAGYSSGGFMANSKVVGNTYAGSQQQWLTRNCDLGPWKNGVWNMVFVGCEGADMPPSNCGNTPPPAPPTPAPTPPPAPTPAPTTCPPCTPQQCGKQQCGGGAPFACLAGGCSGDAKYWPAHGCPQCCDSTKCPHGGPLPATVTRATPVIMEKPFVSFEAGAFVLNVPPVRLEASGANWTVPAAGKIDFSHVYVTQPPVPANATGASASGGDSAADINAKLAQGLHVVLSPGIYLLSESLVLAFDGQVGRSVGGR